MAPESWLRRNKDHMAMKDKKPKDNLSSSVIPADAFFEANSYRGDATVLIDSRELKLTHLHKIFWPEDGYTKFDLLKYYYTISKTILPYLKHRPLILKRYPNGITGQML